MILAVVDTHHANKLEKLVHEPLTQQLTWSWPPQEEKKPVNLITSF